MLKSGRATALAAIMVCSGAAAQAQGQTASEAQVEEIVVTGRRSGVPIWTVRSDSTTLFLVGSIEGVSKTTKWDPEALTQVLRRADRVMFPQMHAYTASLFSAIGWVAKYQGMGSLPKTQSLSQFARPEEMRRLAALAGRKMVRADYDRRHPLHLSRDLQDRAKGDVDYGSGVSTYVRKAVGKYKLNLVPIAKAKAKPLVKDFFASTPDEHLPCLSASIALAEAGPAAVQARSDAWAGRRVQDVLNSPAQAPWERCWPADAVARDHAELMEQLSGLLAEPKVTVAVLSLPTLAGSGAVLDRLEAAGFDIQGPAWK